MKMLLVLQHKNKEFMICSNKQMDVYDFTDMLSVFVQENVCPRLLISFIDEAQDLNPCKMEWCLRQSLRRQTFFVGDSVQMIYRFSGSESRSLMCLEIKLRDMICKMFEETGHLVTDPQSQSREKVDPRRHTFLAGLTLTKSFRFGQNIADVANWIIAAKYHSKQSTTFERYYVRGKVSREPWRATRWRR